jgi:hypothetical protein
MNVRDTVERKVFYPTREYAEDVEFNHVLEDNGFLAMTCNRFLMRKLNLKKLDFSNRNQPLSHNDQLRIIDSKLQKLGHNRIEENLNPFSPLTLKQAIKCSLDCFQFDEIVKGFPLQDLAELEALCNKIPTIKTLQRLSELLGYNLGIITSSGLHLPPRKNISARYCYIGLTSTKKAPLYLPSSPLYQERNKKRGFFQLPGACLQPNSKKYRDGPTVAGQISNRMAFPTVTQQKSSDCGIHAIENSVFHVTGQRLKIHTRERNWLSSRQVEDLITDLPEHVRSRFFIVDTIAQFTDTSTDSNPFLEQWKTKLCEVGVIAFIVNLASGSTINNPATQSHWIGIVVKLVQGQITSTILDSLNRSSTNDDLKLSLEVMLAHLNSLC